MGKGLPKKYAKMGFKKGWREYKKTKRKTASKRKGGKKKSGKKKYSKSYSKPSNPGGGASTPKLGKIFASIKGAVNYGASAIGASQIQGTAGQKMENAVTRYSGYNPADGTFNIDRALPTWQGVATTALLQYADAKTRHYGNISRKKLLDIAEEAVPMFQAYVDGGDAALMTNSYNAATTGNNAMAAQYGRYELDYVKPYATMKAVRIGLDFLGVRKFINKRLPKGLNL